jgi:hypothetical protein
LDSQAVVGQGSSVRLDGYVYTTQSLSKALRSLKPGGVLVLSFACPPWTFRNLYKTFATVTNDEPLALLKKVHGKWGDQVYFVVQKGVPSKDTMIPPDYNRLQLASGVTDGRLLTDDWPYLYVNPKVIDIPYLLVLAECLLLAAFAGRKFLLQKPEGGNWQMFFLGAGFMLLELQSISRLSLLYGSTWITSSIVINGVLIMILLANAFVLKMSERLQNKLPLLYALHGAAILLSFALPIQSLLANEGGRVATTIVSLLPMLMAAMIFAVSFARVRSPGKTLGFNLFGAVVGGLLEFLSNYAGINNMLLVALVLYGISFLCAQRAETKDSEPGVTP